ncbi:Sas10 C-terminal domain-containing protein [Tirmania nivea]|nr:Sas10 C-terminal domain-containing protein [Tirmania nivea]
MGRGYKSSRATAHNRDSIRSKPRAPPPPKEWDPVDSKIAAINSYEDVADEVDEFHLQRDKVLLDGGAGAKRIGGRGGKGRESDQESEVEEVWALGSDEDDDDEEEDLEQYATSDEGEEGEVGGTNIGGPRGKAGLSDDDDQEGNEEEDIEGWGTSKSAYYGGNEDEIETEQDALDEEAEARRIQKKQLAAMDAADFMPNLEEWGNGASSTNITMTTATATTKLTTTTETLPTEIPADLSPEERLSLLKTRNPEFEPLSAEFLELQRIYPVLAAQAEKGGEVGLTRYKALAAYLGVLAMYFALLTREEGESWGGVKEHGVMKGLLRCRGLWEGVKGLQEEEVEGGGDDEEGEDVEMADEVDESEDEDEGEDSDEGEEEEEEKEVSPEPVRKKLSKVALARASANGKALAPRKRVKLDLDFDNSPTTTPKPSKFLLPKTTTDLSDLSALIPTATIPTTKSITKKPSKHTKTSDFSDPITLSHADFSEKQSRKSSLRFHAAQLLSKAALRAQAGRHAGGDIDLPRKDKHPERSSLAAVKRDQNLGDDLDLEEPTEQDRSTAREVNGSNDIEDLEYYKSLAAKSRKAKRAENAVAGGFARFEEEEGNMDGKRAIGYIIEKNKGLTPHRKKDVRNPRVKKRKAYEKAKKKLRTVKRVYSGGQQGAYGGEATGIKKGVVRSTKLK